MIELIGWIATVFRAAGMFVKRAILVKCLISFGNLFWMISGILTHNVPLVVSNAICLVAFLWEIVAKLIRR